MGDTTSHLTRLVHQLSTRGSPPPSTARLHATCDRDEIRRWAAEHQAEPSTAEATPSGPAILDLNDGGAGIRFNFPGFGRFRPISWEEWFDNFDRYRLVFVYEAADREQIAARAHELWRARADAQGDARDDWLRAEQDLRRLAGGDSPSVRYWIVKDSDGEESEEREGQRRPTA